MSKVGCLSWISFQFARATLNARSALGCSPRLQQLAYQAHRGKFEWQHDFNWKQQSEVKQRGHIARDTWRMKDAKQWRQDHLCERSQEGGTFGIRQIAAN